MKKKAETFTGKKMRWLRTANTLRGLPPRAVKAAIVIMAHWSEDTDDCFLRQETIARESGQSRRTAGCAIDDLVEAGLLEKKLRGPLIARYRPLIQGMPVVQQSAQHDEPDVVQHAAQLEAPETAEQAFDVVQSEGACCATACSLNTKENTEREELDTNTGGSSSPSAPRGEAALPNEARPRDDRIPLKPKGTTIGGYRPAKALRQWAVEYWTITSDRPDLAANIHDVEQNFITWCRSCPIYSLNYDKRWIDWVKEEPAKTPRPIIQKRRWQFEDTTVEGWVKRLEIYQGKPGLPTRELWALCWGSRPGASGCRVPTEAFDDFAHLYPDVELTKEPATAP